MKVKTYSAAEVAAMHPYIFYPRKPGEKTFQVAVLEPLRGWGWIVYCVLESFFHDPRAMILPNGEKAFLVRTDMEFDFEGGICLLRAHFIAEEPLVSCMEMWPPPP